MRATRLTALADCVTSGGVVCDVGTDHAYLPAILLSEGKVSSAIATDIHAGPLAAAKRTLQQYNLLSKVSFYLCDGLAGIPPEEAARITDIVIAGMGGEMIVHILDQSVWANQKHLILQPMTKFPEVRLFLARAGFFPWRERVVEDDGKYYVIFDVTFSGTPHLLSNAEAQIGFSDPAEETARTYLDIQRHKFRNLALKLANADPARATNLQEFAREIDTLLEGTRC